MSYVPAWLPSGPRREMTMFEILGRVHKLMIIARLGDDGSLYEELNRLADDIAFGQPT